MELTALRLRTVMNLLAGYYEPTTAGRREATVFGSSMVIDVVIADP
jgi:hypothetical protein